jgi:acetone carboxylase alpha subunit
VLVKHGDLICRGHHAGSAWGDPIDRRSELVVQDVQNGWISEGVARDIYGVALTEDDEGTWTADDSATTAAREDIRAQRAARARPAREVYEEERQRVLDRDFPLEALHDMFADATSYEGWHKVFYDFWRLPEDFELKPESPID